MAWFYNRVLACFLKIGLAVSTQCPPQFAGRVCTKICVFPKDFANFKIPASRKTSKTAFFNGRLFFDFRGIFWLEKRQFGLF
jgi:hypothetical protein